MLEAFGFVISIAAIGAMLYVIRLALPGPEHWTRKWEKYHTSDDEQKKIDASDRRERIRKL
jgi:hypothetical protein